MAEIRNLTRNGETFYPLTCTDAVLNRDGEPLELYLTLGDGLVQIGGKIQLKDVPPPSAANDTGLKGEVRFDSNYLYVCIANNQWKRVSLGSW